MISGNCNRSPQYCAMGPGAQNKANQHHFAQQQQQPPQLLFMAGGSVRGFPQMSRGFSMMPNGGPLRPTVAQCDMQQGFGGGYANTGPHFQPHHHYHQQPQKPPQVIHHQPPTHYIQQAYISTPPPVATATPTSLFINGIKNMVKGFIHPLNCDFYLDHHKYYNPKYRNNYMRDMSYTPQHPDPHVQAVMLGLEVGISSANRLAATTKNVPKPSATTIPRKTPPKTSEVVAIFTSEDFPELPVPRRRRSVTPAKTDKTPQQAAVEKQLSPPRPEASVVHPTPKSTFFEIKCTTIPCGRKPTFGGRLKVVPPPFSLNKSPRTCRTRRMQSNTHEDCDTEDDSFVIFPNEGQDDCIFGSFNPCRPPRQRQISECSDDSFVVFSAEDADGLVALDTSTDDDDDDDDDDDIDSEEETSSEEDEDDEDDEEDDSDSGSDEIDNGTDVVDSSFLNRNKTDRNKCAGTTILHSDDMCAGSEDLQLDSGFDEKKVTFNPQPPVVHVMHAWNFAYRAARKGHWEDFARDRNRFQKRIERTSVYLNPILAPEHREKIYKSRFCDGTQQQQQSLPQQDQHTNTTKLETRSPQATAGPSDDNQSLPKLTKLPQSARFQVLTE